MNRIQGVIRLGRTDSIKRNVVLNVNHHEQTNKNSLQKRHSYDCSLNQTLHIESASQGLRNGNDNFMKTHTGAFKKEYKQNIFGMSVQAQSKLFGFKSVSRKNSLTKQFSPLSHAHKNMLNEGPKPVTNEKQLQLIRKIGLLESRIQQLHKQKQIYILKAFQQNKRLADDNTVLRNRLIQFQYLKKQFISNKYEQNNHRTGTTSKPKIVNIQQNMAVLTQLHDEEDGTSIVFQLDQSHGKNAMKQHQKQWTQKIKQLQVQNQDMKTRLKQAQTKIIQMIQLKQQNQNIKEANKELQSQIQKLKSQIIQKGKDIQASNNFSQVVSQQSQYYVNRLLKQYQLSMRKQQQNKLLKADAISKQKLFQNNIKQLQEKNQILSQKLSVPCKKCQNLVKALVKMNQRVYVTGPSSN